jgi:lysophospholipid acyltransferase (LPLAT)-like uncharacterized protein
MANRFSNFEKKANLLAFDKVWHGVLALLEAAYNAGKISIIISSSSSSESVSVLVSSSISTG